MNEEHTSFPIGIDFERVLRVISKQVYETPFAFIRENVQNAVDAIRIQALRDNTDPGNDDYRISIAVEDNMIVVRDNGVGMSARELQDFFWTIGASGKRTEEAQAAGCVGTFGIGGFANFGVCRELEVISCIQGATGTLTRLSEDDIRHAGSSIPSITLESSNASAPRGTVVNGYLREAHNVDELERYLFDFVRFVPISILFNGKKISQQKLSSIEDRDNFTEIYQGPQVWQEGDLAITGRLFEDRGHTLIATIERLSIGAEPVDLAGYLRFENGAIDVFKRGFKLCATQIGCTIGASGRVDCDRFVPTAGRDSLDAATAGLLGQIVLALEKVAVHAVLENPERISQHTRIFRYVIQRGLIEGLDNVRIPLADGTESTLGDVRRKAEQGSVSVFFGLTQKQALSQIMHTRGHLVVQLSHDKNRQSAERQYLERFCDAKAFDGMIECIELYDNLSRFEKVFLSELEQNIFQSYEVDNVQLTPGKLTEDIPVFLKETGGTATLEIFVDVRHQEVAKLEGLGYSPILYSLIATFCREYLGPSLKKWSPRFFGDGALNLELLAKKRSELWVLMKGDIGVVHMRGQREVMTSSDVQVVNIGGEGAQESQPGNSRPKILNIIDEQSGASQSVYYIRLLDRAFRAYGDLLPDCNSRGVVWAGNKILYVVSDAISAAFQYEIRLDRIVAPHMDGHVESEGAVSLEQPLQEMYDGIYFPIPSSLESFLIPHGVDEIRLDLHCDWFDMDTTKHWTLGDADA